MQNSELSTPLSSLYNISVFNDNTLEYESWFEKYPHFFQSELLAFQVVLPQNKKGIEIGVGTGKFAHALSIHVGVEPSDKMASMAESRGIKVFHGVAENLPIADKSFDFVLMVTLICFLKDVAKSLQEANRILKENGELIIGMIDKNRELGKTYEQKKSTSKFYRNACFYSPEEVTEFLKEAGFNNFQYWQTLLHPNENIIEQPQSLFGKGSFVIVKARKISGTI